MRTCGSKKKGTPRDPGLVGQIPAGVLDRLRGKGSTFAYDPVAAPDRAVSVTMPVRVSSWDTPYGLAPIFEMNLPEGALRARLMRRFAKATGRFDDVDLLGVVGRTQIGRLRYSALDAELDEEVPFQSIDEVLRARRGGELFDYLLDRFAAHSGLSGVQPKVLIWAETDGLEGMTSGREFEQLSERDAHREALGSGRLSGTRRQ